MSSSHSPNRLPAWLLLVIAVIGPPSALVLNIFHTLALWQILLFIIVYEILVLFFSLLAGVWQHLQNTWGKRIADQIELRIRVLFSAYRKYYFQHLKNRYIFLETKGLSTQGKYNLDLEQVFVEPNVALTSPQQATADPLKAPRAKHTDQRPIWDYITSKSKPNRRIVMLGAPGSGKTTLMKHITLIMISRKRRLKLKLPYKLPFFLSLKDYSKQLMENSLFSLSDAVQTQTERWERKIPSEWVERQLVKGNCFVIFDGLDEVADTEARRQMAEWVQQQMENYAGNLFLVTSRPFGYRSNPLTGVTVLEIQGFTYVQIEQFVQSWSLAEETKRTQRDDPSVRIKAKDEAKDLLQRIFSSPALFRLAVNPLLLTMITLVHRHQGALPGNRAALYKEILQVTLGQRQALKGLKQELDHTQKQWVMQRLAYHMMMRGVTEIAPDRAYEVIEKPLTWVRAPMNPKVFLQMIEGSSGLWLERETGVYGFSHSSLQEYLTAVYMHEERQEKFLLDQIENSWWRESILLYCALANANPIISACLLRSHLSIPALTLALACREMATFIQPAVTTQLEAILDQGAEDVNPERRRIVAEALLARRLEDQMIPLSEDLSIDTSLITCAEYQWFLDDQLVQGQKHQPDHWNDDRFPPGQSQKPVLGVRPTDAVAFCEWLTEYQSDLWRYRLPSSDELEQLESVNGTVRETDNLEVDTGCWTDAGESFVQAKGGKHLSITLTQEQLDILSTQDDNRVQNYPLRRDNPGYSDLEEHIAIVRQLSHARTLHNELISLLSSIRIRIQTREQNLQNEFQSARERRSNLESQLNRLRGRMLKAQSELGSAEASLKALESQLSGATAHKDVLQTKLDNVRSDEHNTQKEFNSAEENEQAFIAKFRTGGADTKVQAQLASASNWKNELQAKLDSIRSDEFSTQNQLDRIEKRESRLQTQIDTESGVVRELQTLIDRLTKVEHEQDLPAQLQIARVQENNLQTQLNIFTAKARPYLDIFARFLDFTPTYNSNEVLTSALVHNQTLNLDHILINAKNRAFEDALTLVGNHVSAYVERLMLVLSKLHENEDIDIDGNGKNESTNILHIHALIRELDAISLNDHILELARFLKKYCDHLAQRRPSGEKSNFSLRLYIRYFSRELAHHLSYWSWKDLFTSVEQSNYLLSANRNMIDAYFDIYIAFTLLEERIDKKLSASEGLLVVREHKREG